MEKKKLGFVMTGSFCTFEAVIEQMRKLSETWDITPIMSFHAYSTDTRFGKAEDFHRTIEEICGKPILHTIVDTEPVGPKKMFDILLVAPCTGNTIAKIAHAITDTPAIMAVKSHLRNKRPVVLAISTNDSLSGSAQNIGKVLNNKNFYFVPAAQDNPEGKPTSVVADFSSIEMTLDLALKGIQIQPMLR